MKQEDLELGMNNLGDLNKGFLGEEQITEIREARREAKAISKNLAENVEDINSWLDLYQELQNALGKIEIKMRMDEADGFR